MGPDCSAVVGTGGSVHVKVRSLDARISSGRRKKRKKTHNIPRVVWVWYNSTPKENTSEPITIRETTSLRNFSDPLSQSYILFL